MVATRITSLERCLLFVLVLATPSCLTAHVWSRYEPDWAAPVTAHAEGHYESHGMLFCSAAGGVSSRPSLAWVQEASGHNTARTQVLVAADDAASCVPTILEARGMTILRTAMATDIVAEDCQLRRSSKLEIEYTVAPGGSGRLVAPESLPQHCAESMYSAESLSMLARNDLISNLRRMMARCVGLSDAWQLEAWQITDEDFTPIHAESPLQALLQPYTRTLVVGRFRSPRGVQYGVLPGPVAALLASSKVVSPAHGSCLHASRWHAVPTTKQNVEAARRVLGPTAEHVRRIDQSTRSVFAVDGDFFVCLLVTPITLACDIVLGPGTLRLWQAMTGDPPPRPRVDPRDPITPRRGS